MTESMLLSLMKLFAILASINEEATAVISRSFVESYLKTQFSGKFIEKALQKFDQNLEELSVLKGLNTRRKTSALSVQILSICDKINKELHIKNKYLILFSLIQFSKYFDDNTGSDKEFKQTISDTVKTISEGLLIQNNEFLNCRAFIADKFYKVPDKKNLLVISDDSAFMFTEVNHYQKDKIKGQLFFLKIIQADIYIFYYNGDTNLTLGGKNIYPRHVYLFPKGSSLKGDDFTPIYYSDIVHGFFRKKGHEELWFEARNIEFQYKNSVNGIHKFNFTAGSGELIGIMGGSGAGKSTLLKVLNGSYTPGSGNIYINGHDLHLENERLKGIIGYVPQDDLLIEELTVYQNLYFNARLCLGDMTDEHIRESVDKILGNLDLFDIRNMIVGSPINKYISGGQRKRLNIALELVMEPHILFADEPTSGLSSTDSENVMQLLKEQALSGKIVIVNIHQPSSELFKMFDKLLILDKGGFPVYSGNPLDAFPYLKSIAQRVDAEEIECHCCGNVQTDDLLSVVEAKQVNEFGEFTNERLISPEKWYEFFNSNLIVSAPTTSMENNIPRLKFKVPGKAAQFVTYSLRNFYSKIADRQYVLFSMLIPTILAIILGFFTRYVKGTPDNPKEYIFSLNENLPAYIFMCVIVALFLGLIISAEEIIKDRKILQRESFLNLSRRSYLNSKILFLFLLSAIQMLIFTLLGNQILEIKGMNFGYWLVLFSSACFAVMLGLNISSGLKSVVAIYINIPFILVPLILLAGIIVKFDKLHYTVASTEYTPLAGDIMASRWAYEALMVHQFSNNEYQSHFLTVERELNNSLYDLNFLIPELLHKKDDYERYLKTDNDTVKALSTLSVIHKTMLGLDNVPGLINPVAMQTENEITDLARVSVFLQEWKNHLVKKTNALEYQKDKIIDDLMSNGLSAADITMLKEDHYNVAVSQHVLNTNEMRKITLMDGKLIRKDTPIYQYTSSRAGRAQFYAGEKRIGPYEINTLWFNVLVLWIMTLLLYLSLVYDLFRRIFSTFGRE